MLEQLVHIVTTVWQTVNLVFNVSHTVTYGIKGCVVPTASLDAKQQNNVVGDRSVTSLLCNL